MAATVGFFARNITCGSGLAEATDAAMLCSVNLFMARTDRLGCFMQLVCLPRRSLVSTCNLLIPADSSCNVLISSFIGQSLKFL